MEDFKEELESNICGADVQKPPRKHFPIKVPSARQITEGCKKIVWEMKELAAERLYQKERGNPGVTASPPPQPPLRGVGGGGMQGWRDERRRKESEQARSGTG